MRLPYTIDVSTKARDHIRNLTARDRSLVLDAIEEQLTYQPSVETRNRKQLRRNELALWELRVGVLRVYYDVEESPDPTVVGRVCKLRAIG